MAQATSASTTLDHNENAAAPRKVSNRPVVVLPQVVLRGAKGDADTLISDPMAEFATSTPLGSIIDRNLGQAPLQLTAPALGDPHNVLTMHQPRMKISAQKSLSSCPLEVCVFLPDCRGIQFTVEDGRQTGTAASLLLLVKEHLDLKDERELEALSLWMMSSSLAVQLKPYHVAYQVRLAFPELLRRYGDPADDSEPLLMVRRNVALDPVSEQKHYTDSCLLNVLYTDAFESFITGKLLADQSTALRLAALGMAIRWGPYVESTHTIGFIRDHLSEVLPPHPLRPQTVSLFGYTLAAQPRRLRTLLTALQRQYQEYSNKKNCARSEQLQRCFLKLASKLPTYGAATFPATTNVSLLRLSDSLSAYHTIPVDVTVNRHFLSLVDSSKHEMLLCVPIVDCHWKLLPSKDSTPARLLLHFPDYSTEQSTSSGRSALLQLVSRQCRLLDALLQSMTTLSRADAALGQSTGDTLDVWLQERLDEYAGSEQMRSRLDTLALIHFDAKGNCTKCAGPLSAWFKPESK